jgi:LysM repeat protein
MLNKDQYDQEEYNDYYAQEIRGAEILGGKKEGGNGKKGVFIAVLLLLISALGYFGWKIIGSSSSSTSTDTKEVSTLVESTEGGVNTPQNETISKKELIAKNVAEIALKNSNGDKMSPEDIANIVKTVMHKMNEEKSKGKRKATETAQQLASQQQLKDKKLMESLSDLEVDSLSVISDDVDKLPDVAKSKQASSIKNPDTYNKVVLENKKADSNDELSKLSNQISNIVGQEDTASKEENTYAKSIKNEVKVRKKEMRYVTVRKGDTLGKIAKRVYGKASDYKKIFRANPDILRRADKIYIGQRLRVPE